MFQLFLGSLLLLAAPLRAEPLDLSNRSEAGGPYEVGFCARPSPSLLGFPGHAFVSFREGSGGRSRFIALGRTTADPVPAVLSYFGDPAHGSISEEMYSHIKQDCFVVRVNSDSYENAKSRARPRLASIGIDPAVAATIENYSLGSDDCLTFVGEVADALAAAGLRVPARTATDLPLDYIDKLRRANDR